MDNKVFQDKQFAGRKKNAIAALVMQPFKT
jgi:hypothetical protein